MSIWFPLYYYTYNTLYMNGAKYISCSVGNHKDRRYYHATKDLVTFEYDTPTRNGSYRSCCCVC